mmetsp:Transcript_67405/g.161156  ORF Transcript_67405/g.161156 Transcript_67405/m.161156 type:complete len:227 (-) Transcript_67405:623-1303(-)
MELGRRIVDASGRRRGVPRQLRRRLQTLHLLRDRRGCSIHQDRPRHLGLHICRGCLAARGRAVRAGRGVHRVRRWLRVPSRVRLRRVRGWLLQGDGRRRSVRPVRRRLPLLPHPHRVLPGRHADLRPALGDVLEPPRGGRPWRVAESVLQLHRPSAGRASGGWHHRVGCGPRRMEHGFLAMDVHGPRVGAGRERGRDAGRDGRVRGGLDQVVSGGLVGWRGLDWGG